MHGRWSKTDSLPEEIRAQLEPSGLEQRIRSLATLIEGRQAGVPVSVIAGNLMAPCDLSGPERARVYVALRQVVRERVEAVDGLRYVPGSL